MNTKILASILLGILTFAFIYINPSSRMSEISLTSPPPPVNNNISDSFLIGCMDNGQDAGFNYIIDTLGFNLWHKYCGDTGIGGKRYPTGWVRNGAPGDNLFAGYNDYVSQVQGVLNNVENHNMKALMSRPKIDYLCYGQRSDYQCEEIPQNDNYWFYSFNVRHPTAEQTTDSGQGVIHCRYGVDNPDFAVKRLKANSEQCNSSSEGDAYRWDSQSDWLIKPRIRIDSAFANNPANLDKLVCRVDVRNQENNLIKSIDVRVRNFKLNLETRYNGNYMEEFNFGQPWNDTSSQNRTGAWGDWWVYSARGNSENDDNCSKADIQVYWYGNCDMWLDYVRVDNDVAHNLLSTDTTNQTHQTYLQWLLWEAQAIANYGNSPLQFYIELFEFNNIPCIAYVNQKLQLYSGRPINVMGETLAHYQYHMPSWERGSLITPEKIKTMYFEKTASKQVFVGDPYPITAAPPNPSCGTQPQFSKIPNTLPIYSGDSILADDVSPLNYDAWLQGLLDTACPWYEGGIYNHVNYLNPGVFRFLLQNGDAISKESNIPLIVMLQAHQWVSPGEVDREPTTEELNVMTNMAVSYGARGIIYWGITSFYENECHNTRAIMESDVTPRYTNVYGQPKLEMFQETVGRLKTWGPTLMSFTNADRRTYIYRLERVTCLNESYFSDIVTYYPSNYPTYNCVEDDPGDSNPPLNWQYDCKQQRYLQVATFKEYSTGKRTYPYFMIVNRRCSPHLDQTTIDRNGGYRKIRLKFDTDHNALSGYNEWVIKDFAKPDWEVSFNKTQSLFLELGDFMPGEGRLYHLVPKAQSGGIMLGDELITSGEEFTCEDTVWTNGYNLTIEDGVTIHFSDSAKFVVNGGTFQIGNPQHSGPNTITMDAASGNTWKGFEFNGANVKIYGVNFSGHANDSIAMLSMIDCPLIDLKNNSFSLGIFYY
jgi:hypothetical protein